MFGRTNEKRARSAVLLKRAPFVLIASVTTSEKDAAILAIERPHRDLFTYYWVSLLVIPDHHRRGHFRDYPEFCEWLRRQVAAGCEAVIHGYYHERPARAGEGWRDRFITRSYTAGE